ncbi:nuclear pore glycoprotein p62-like [Astyanax mexicanus]|uniref:Nuclear pore glycoprotein p62 n=1 Tax=Astyanax mexicanus TaxID=7994 RepID=A0A8T2LPR4_ASTMX|nr:nuclear pore glycoprotein p62-like [Astyanax mexicanus]
MSFSFGQASAGSGFTFGTPKTTSSAPAAATGFGQLTSTPAAGGFTFGAPTQPQAQPQTQASVGTSQIAGLLAQPAANNGASQGGFSFGAATQNTAPAPGGFSFGAPTAKLGLGLPTASQPASTGVSLGGLAAPSSTGTGFTLGGLGAQTTAGAQPSTGGFSFGMTKVQTTAALAVQTTPALSLGVQPTGLWFILILGLGVGDIALKQYHYISWHFPTPAPTATAAAGLAAPGSSLFATPIPSAAGSSFTSAATSAAPTGFSLGLKPVVSAAPAISTVASTAGITVSAAPVMSYAQLEALINKWSSELEDQERHFLQQATQVNAWDRMLVENGEKITALHKDMEKVKLDQRRLDQELDFILSQQKELEDLLAPLEESVKEQSGTIYMQNADEERERTYKLAENVDAQLKRMSQDLKEIIEHLNTSNGPADTSDPLQQICKILNAHMDSLQWVEQNSVLLQRRVEEVSKLCESRSKEQEKSFRLNFQ